MEFVLSAINKVVLFDNDVFLVDELKLLDKRLPSHSLVIVSRQSELIKLIQDKLEPVDLLIIKDGLPNTNTEQLVANINEINSELQIIIVYDKKIQDSLATRLRAMGIAEILEKPKNLEKYLSLARKVLKERYNWSGVEATQEDKDKELDLDEGQLIAIMIKDIILTPKSFFNIYLSLSANKYVKILNAGDPVTKDFLDKYSNKNIENFHVLKNEHLKYMKLCNAYIEKELISSPQGIEKNSANILHNGDNLAKNLAKAGIGRENIQVARDFLQGTYQFIRRSRPTNQSFAKLLNTLIDHEHASTVILLSTLLSKELGFESSKTVQIVGTAAMLHDIHLVKQNSPVIESVLQLSDKKEDRELFDCHAKEGARYLRELGIFDEIICQAVEQHHLRKNLKGAKISDKLNLVSEIIGVCDDFSNIVLDAKNPETELDSFLRDILPQFSLKIQKGFESIVNGKAKKSS
jgi:HD-GYP domain-containing protein (c-di-GMP phosphodiesterase class II)